MPDKMIYLFGGEFLWSVYMPGLHRVFGRVEAMRSAPEQVQQAAVEGSSTTTRKRLTVVRGVAVIDLVGPLTKEPSLWHYYHGGLTMPEMTDQVKVAVADRRVKAILLRIDSPGGTVAGVSDLADAVFGAGKIKPVVAYCSDLCASCGYYVASQAGKIYGDVDAMVGCIGTVLVIDDFSEMFKKAGIETIVFKSEKDPFKGEGVAGSKITDEQKEDFQRVVDDLGRIFVEAVYRGRPSLKESKLKLPDGRVYIGQNAVDLGLMDGIRSMDEVIEKMQQGDLLAEDVPGTNAGAWNWNENTRKFQKCEGAQK